MPAALAYVVGGLVVLGGIANAIAPHAVWAFNARFQRWQYRDRRVPEPSRAALTISRLTGVAAAVFGVVWLVVAPHHLG